MLPFTFPLLPSFAHPQPLACLFSLNLPFHHSLLLRHHLTFSPAILLSTYLAISVGCYVRISKYHDFTHSQPPLPSPTPPSTHLPNLNETTLLSSLPTFFTIIAIFPRCKHAMGIAEATMTKQVPNTNQTTGSGLKTYASFCRGSGTSCSG